MDGPLSHCTQRFSLPSPRSIFLLAPNQAHLDLVGVQLVEDGLSLDRSDLLRLHSLEGSDLLLRWPFLLRSDLLSRLLAILGELEVVGEVPLLGEGGLLSEVEVAVAVVVVRGFSACRLDVECGRLPRGPHIYGQA